MRFNGAASLFTIVFFNPWRLLEVSSFDKAYLNIIQYIMALIESVITLIP